jgi:pimeloyl-ACP methyl ester carboxylesterase
MNKNTTLLLVHGFASSPLSMHFGKRFFEKQGWENVKTFSYFAQTGSIAEHAKRLDDYIADISGTSGNVVVIGWSMGGIIAAYQSAYGKHQKPVSKLVTISSPFGGSHIANAAKFLGPFAGYSGAQMKGDSQTLNKLQNPAHCPNLCVGGGLDVVVRPHNAKRPGSEFRLFPAADHFSILVFPSVWRYVAKWIAE